MLDKMPLCSHFSSLSLPKKSVFCCKKQASHSPQDYQLCLSCGQSRCDCTYCSYNHFSQTRTHAVVLNMISLKCFCFICKQNIAQIPSFNLNKTQSRSLNQTKKLKDYQKMVEKTFELLDAIKKMMEKRSIQLAIPNNNALVESRRTNKQYKIQDKKKRFNYLKNQQKEQELKKIVKANDMTNKMKMNLIDLQFEKDPNTKIPQKLNSKQSSYKIQQKVNNSIRNSSKATNSQKIVEPKEHVSISKTQKVMNEKTKYEQIKNIGMLYNQAYLDKSKQLPIFGLANIGNTCYFNSILQCIFSIPDLHEFYANLQKSVLDHQKFLSQNLDFTKEQLSSMSYEDLNLQSNLNGHYKPIAQLNIIFKKFLKNKQKIFCPRSLFSAVCKHKPSFRNMGQQDAQQLYGLLINSLIDAQKSARNITKQFQRTIIDNKGNAHFTSIQKMFGFFLASRLHCLDCNKIGWTFDFALDLSVQLSKASLSCEQFKIAYNDLIPAEQLKQNQWFGQLFYPQKSESSCFIDIFFRPQQLSMRNSFKCQKCKSPKSIKKFYIKNPPKILMVGLKRFNNNGSKNNTIVSFPQFMDLKGHVLTENKQSRNSFQKTEKQQMKQYERELQKHEDKKQQSFQTKSQRQSRRNKANKQQSSFIYQIFGGVVHGGSSMAGHYVAYTRRGGEWYYFSDTNLKPSSLQKFKLAQPYLLFYRRVDKYL